MSKRTLVIAGGGAGGRGGEEVSQGKSSTCVKYGGVVQAEGGTACRRHRPWLGRGALVVAGEHW